jgi:hypothetical protein
MNDLQRSVKSQNPPIKSRLPAQTGQKLTICLLAALIVTVMIVWFSFRAGDLLHYCSGCLIALRTSGCLTNLDNQPPFESAPDLDPSAVQAWPRVRLTANELSIATELIVLRPVLGNSFDGKYSRCWWSGIYRGSHVP